MRILGTFLAVFLVSFAHAQPLQTWTQEQLAIPVLRGALWGGVAAYTDAPQEPLFAVAADTRLTPASTLKLLTTAAALETFGPLHRFKTELYAEQLPDENGVLHGNLYVRGGGDPTLGSTRVAGGVAASRFTNVAKSGSRGRNPPHRRANRCRRFAFWGAERCA